MIWKKKDLCKHFKTWKKTCVGNFISSKFDSYVFVECNKFCFLVGLYLNNFKTTLCATNVKTCHATSSNFCIKDVTIQFKSNKNQIE